MVAEPFPLLSEQPPELPQRAGLGDRFHYFRGRSGRRYLFSKVDAGEVPDFPDAVVITAEPAAGGRLSVRAAGLTSSDPLLPAARRPPGGSATVFLVHLLATTAAQRLALIRDLASGCAELAA